MTRRFSVCPLLVLLVAAAAACDGAATAEPDSTFPNIDYVRLVIGGRVVSVNALGAESGGPAPVRVGTTVGLTATFHMPNGVIDPRVTAASYQLTLVHLAGAPMTYQPSATNPFAGTLTAAQTAGGVSFRLSLIETTSQRIQFGPYNLTLTVIQ